MGASRGSGIFITVLLTIIAMAPRFALACEHPYADRLFLVAETNETFYGKKSFFARCGTETKRFFEITLDESRGLGREVFVFSYDFQQVKGRGLNCFTTDGKFVSCSQLASLDLLEDGWNSCEILSHNASEYQPWFSAIYSNAVKHFREYAVSYAAGSMLMTGIVSAVAWQQVCKAKRDLALGNNKH